MSQLIPLGTLSSSRPTSAAGVTTFYRPPPTEVSVKVRYWLRIFTKVLVGFVFFLIFLGANVKSHEAGLAVPDWPTSYGYNMFTFPVSYWVGGIFHEHFHRLIASFVGALTVVMAVWIWMVEPRRWVRNLAGVAVAAVLVQGLLGGLTVIWQLPAWTSSAHGVLGQLFLCMTIALAYSQSRELLEPDGTRRYLSVIPQRTAIVLFGLIFAQLILAAFMRHTESGLAVPDFPTMGGDWIPSLNAAEMGRINSMRSAWSLPPVVEYQVLLHLLHRAVGVIIVGFGLWALHRAMLRSGGEPKVRKTLGFWGVLTMVQFTLGVISVLTVRAPYPTTVHVAGGALLLAASMLLILRVWALQREDDGALGQE